MQSSLLLVVRALLIVAFLVVVPLTAVLGWPLTEVLQTAIDRIRPIVAATSAGDGRRALRADVEKPRLEPIPTAPRLEPDVVFAVETHAADDFPPGVNAPISYYAAPDGPSRLPNGPARDKVFSPPTRTSRADETQPSPDRFRVVERRLRQLGATYLLLETWGQQGQKYRFYCKVSIAGDSNDSRHFEATGTTALAAMKRVLGDVQAWRSAWLR